MKDKWLHMTMASVTIKGLDDGDLQRVAAKARTMGLSTQQYLRQLVARDARLPMVPDELSEILAAHRASRKPMSMKQFEAARRSAWRR